MTADARVVSGEVAHAADEAVASAPERDRGAHMGALDGIRGLAALFVVLHHCYLVSFPGDPRATGPWWAGWMLYGHLAVVVFIVLSGFSLALGPAHRGWRLGRLTTYVHRRAWRILSAYWPALVFSIAMAWIFLPQPGEGRPNARSALVFGLLVQDVTGAPTPNGAFWSIAIEAQLYALLPLLLVVLRRRGAALALAVVTLPVLVIGVLAPTVPIVALFTRFTPQLAVGFTVGVLAADIVRAPRWGHQPLLLLSVGAVVPPLCVIAVAGSPWTAEHYFWVDLAMMPSIALLLAAIAARKAPRVSRLLSSRPLRSLGGFSYSLYLVHAPLVVAVSGLVVRPRLAVGVQGFLLTLVLAVPLALVVSRLFAAFFDLPFQRHKSWPALRAAAVARLASVRRRGAAPVGASEEESPAT